MAVCAVAVAGVKSIKASDSKQSQSDSMGGGHGNNGALLLLFCPENHYYYYFGISQNHYYYYFAGKNPLLLLFLTQKAPNFRACGALLAFTANLAWTDCEAHHFHHHLDWPAAPQRWPAWPLARIWSKFC